MEISAATRQSISLTPDIRTNTIIVRAPRESMELIQQMVDDLDGSTSGSQNIRIFKMVNADASQMARILKELFSLRQQGSLYVLKPRETADQAPAEIGASAAANTAATQQAGTLGADLTLVPDDRQQLSITVDDRTNSLLVSGTPNYLTLVETVVNELDRQQANERDTFAYKLKNATAVDVAKVVNDFVSEDQKKILQTLSADELPSASKLLEREVTVVGDQKSTTVLVNASPRYMEKVQEIIKELDVDPPQVLIQVLLAEVSLDKSESLGPEFGNATIGEFGVAAGMGNMTRVPGTQLLGSLFTNSGTPNVAIGAEDFELLINALASQSRVQVLSNPSVMVENNSKGFIQVGETVRLPSGQSFSSAGQSTSVTPEDIGIILTVTPSINPEGFVRMQIEPEISRLSLQTTQLSEDFNSPVITRRRATTTVTVKDGQTVVIGVTARYLKESTATASSASIARYRCSETSQCSACCFASTRRTHQKPSCSSCSLRMSCVRRATAALRRQAILRMKASTASRFLRSCSSRSARVNSKARANSTVEQAERGSLDEIERALTRMFRDRSGDVRMSDHDHDR